MATPTQEEICSRRISLLDTKHSGGFFLDEEVSLPLLLGRLGPGTGCTISPAEPFRLELG